MCPQVRILPSLGSVSSSVKLWGSEDSCTCYSVQLLPFTHHLNLPPLPQPTAHTGFLLWVETDPSAPRLCAWGGASPAPGHPGQAGHSVHLAGQTSHSAQSHPLPSGRTWPAPPNSTLDGVLLKRTPSADICASLCQAVFRTQPQRQKC